MFFAIAPKGPPATFSITRKFCHWGRVVGRSRGGRYAGRLASVWAWKTDRPRGRGPGEPAGGRSPGRAVLPWSGAKWAEASADLIFIPPAP